MVVGLMPYFLSPIGTSCHLRLRGGRAPFVAIATFPPFQRGHLPVSSGTFTRFIGGVYSWEGELLNRVFYLSLRGSAATAAIRWNDEWSIYRALFQGDRHAYARDDTEIQLSLRGSEATKQSPGRVEVYGVYVSCFFGGIAAVATLLRNDIDSLAGYFAVAQYDGKKQCGILRLRSI